MALRQSVCALLISPWLVQQLRHVGNTKPEHTSLEDGRDLSARPRIHLITTSQCTI